MIPKVVGPGTIKRPSAPMIRPATRMKMIVPKSTTFGYPDRRPGNGSAAVLVVAGPGDGQLPAHVLAQAGRHLVEAVVERAGAEPPCQLRLALAHVPVKVVDLGHVAVEQR